MKQFKRFSYFFSKKEAVVKAFFVFSFLVFSLFPNLSYSQCNCDNPTTVGTNVGIPTLSNQNLIDPSQVFSGCLTVNGKFTVDNFWTIDGAEIIMLGGAEIVVAGNWLQANNWFTTLSLLNSNIHGCEKLWKSISVKTFGHLIFKGNMVSDAEYALNFPEDLPHVQIENNQFVENYVGIYAPPTSNSKFIKRIDELPISGNTFNCPGVLLPHYNPNVEIGFKTKAGVWVNDVRYFAIGNYDNLGFQNYFEGIDQAVLAESCVGTSFSELQIQNLSVDNKYAVEVRYSDEMQVKHSVMNDIAYGINGVNSGININDNSISVDVTGIYLGGVTNKYNWIGYNPLIESNGDAIILSDVNSEEDDKGTHIVGNNIVTNVTGHGISMGNCNSLIRIENNIIDLYASTNTQIFGINMSIVEGKPTIKNNMINMNNGSSIENGIGVFGSNDVQIIENKIYGPSSNTFGGAAIFPGGSNNILYCCNEFNNTGWGYYFATSNINHSINTTKFGNHGIGIFVPIEIQMVGQQFHTGNDWSSANCTQWDAEYSGNPLFVSASKFFVNLDKIPNGLSKINVANGSPADWFQIESSPDDQECDDPNIINCGVTPFPLTGNPTELTPTDFEITNIDSWEEVSNQSKWNSKYYLYKKLKENPVLINENSNVDAFFSVAENSLLEGYFEINEDIKSNFLPPNEYKVDLNTLQSDLAANISEIKDVEVQMLIATPSELNSLIQQKDNLVENMGDIWDKMNGIRNQIKIAQIQEANLLLALNSNLSFDYIFQENEKLINEIILQTTAQGVYEFDGVQKNTIASVAQQCPENGGKAVWKARALQSLYMNISYEDKNCGQKNARLGSNKESIVPVKIFPNPNNGIFTINLGKPLEMESKVTLYDLRGNELYSMELEAEKISFELNTQKLQSGVYVCKINSNNQDIAIKRITVFNN